MKRVLLFSLVASATLLPARAIEAQRIDSPYRFLDYGQQVGVYVGRMGAEEGPLQIGPQPATTLGARWALRVSGPLSLGAEVGYTPTTRTVRDTVFVAADSLFREVGEANVRMLTVMGNLNFGITGPRTWYGLHPFIVLGAGVSVDIAGADAIEADLPAAARYERGTSFAGQFGGGVDWYPTQRVSVRVDARNVLWRVRAPEAFRRTTAGAQLAEAEWTNNFALLAGLSFHF